MQGPRKPGLSCFPAPGIRPALLLAAFLLPGLALAWTVNERCELERAITEGPVAVAPIAGGIVLYLPDGLAENGTRVKVSIGSRSWRVPLVAGGVELEGGEKAFLEKNWLSVHGGGDHLLGFSLIGTSAVWEKLARCKPPPPEGWLTLSGEIGPETDDEVIVAIRRQRPEGLLLDSPGGLAEQAQRIGQAVRDAGMKTRVASGGSCLVECVFVLAAGVPREVDSAARIGLRPSLFTGGLGVYHADPLPVSDSAVYFSHMGIDGGKLAVFATGVEGDDLHLLSANELREAGLVDAATAGRAAPVLLGRLSQAGDPGRWWWVSLLVLAFVLWWVTGRWREG